MSSNIPRSDFDFKNKMSAKTFRDICVTATVVAVLYSLEFIVKMLQSANEDYYIIATVISPVLAIIGTIGLWMAYTGAKNSDSRQIVSGTKMARCYVVSELIFSILSYIIGAVCITVAFIFLFFPSAIIEISRYDFASALKDFLYEFGDFSANMPFIETHIAFTIFGVVCGFAGVIFLVIATLVVLHRSGLSKCVKFIIAKESGKTANLKMPSFTIVFGYIMGVFLIITSADLTVFFTDLSVLECIYTVIGNLGNIALGILLIMISALLGAVKKEAFEPKIDFNYYNPVYNPNQGINRNPVYPMQPPVVTAQNGYTPPARKLEEETAEAAAGTEEVTAAAPQSTETPDVKPDEQAKSSFCKNCGVKTDSNQFYCSHCGCKLK